jgi:hypothetical protein
LKNSRRFVTGSTRFEVWPSGMVSTSSKEPV